MDEEKKQCRWCDYFSLYYTCGCNNFYPEQIGRCQEYNKTVSIEAYCEKWKCSNIVRDYRKKRVLMAIVGMRDKLEAIERTIQQEIDIEKLNKNDN